MIVKLSIRREFTQILGLAKMLLLNKVMVLFLQVPAVDLNRNLIQNLESCLKQPNRWFPNSVSRTWRMAT